MKPEWCPQWAWDEAKDRSKNSFLSFDLDEAHEVVARALLDAHQRGKDEGLAIGKREGMEEAAEIAQQAGDRIQPAAGYLISEAIRAKAQEAAKEGG